MCSECGVPHDKGEFDSGKLCCRRSLANKAEWRAAKKSEAPPAVCANVLEIWVLFVYNCSPQGCYANHLLLCQLHIAQCLSLPSHILWLFRAKNGARDVTASMMFLSSRARA